MLAWVASASGCAPAAAGPAPRTVLVELFTSQGCSSCPAADAFVRDFPTLGLSRARVVPLTFHVDYWNELGWPDPFSSPAFTERQRRYGEAGHLRDPDGGGAMTGLYTPQMIVDGAIHFSGARRAVALAEIDRAAAKAPMLDVDGDAGIDGERATITLRVRPRSNAVDARDWQVFVALAAKTARTNILRGENRGATLEEAVVVRALSTARPVSFGTPLRFTVQKPRDLAWSAVELAAVVQSPTTMQVAAARSLVPHPGGAR
jgi:hypothetical protein